MERWLRWFSRILIPTLCLSESPLFARWTHQQADRPDEFAKLGKEYYNDILSYRFSADWIDRWQGSDAAVMASAGSLNQKDFIYDEQLKLRSPADDPWQLGFAAKRQESPSHASTESEIELSYGGPRWRIGLLADAHGEKQFSDIGLSAGFRTDAFRLKAKLWSIDPFYEDKKLNKNDKRNGAMWNQQLTLEGSVGPWLLGIAWAEDTPLIWERESKLETYRFSRTEVQPGIRYRSAEKDFFIRGTSVLQKEGISRSEGSHIAKHRLVEFEAGIEGPQDSLSLWSHQSRTDYRGIAPFARLPGVGGTERDEFALVGQRRLAFFEKHEQILGFILNQLSLREEKARQSTELKFQWSMDFRLNRQSRLLLGTTWDMDQFVDDLSRRSLTMAWGGGYGQIMLAF